MSINQRLAGLLEQVAQGCPVNMESLARQLCDSGALHFTELQRIFTYDQNARDPRIVEIKDMFAFESIRQRYPVDATSSRLSAALAGDSHRVGVSGCMVIMDSLMEERPSVCVVRDGVTQFPWSIGQTLVVVENEELLIQKPLLRDMLVNYCNISHVDEADLMLGGGTRAASRYHGLIYEHYDEVYFLFDLDLGGLRAFKSILSLSDHPEKCHFLLPNNIDELLAVYRERHKKSRLGASQREALEKYVGVHADMDLAVRLIAKYQCMPEQEVYLALMEVSADEQ